MLIINKNDLINVCWYLVPIVLYNIRLREFTTGILENEFDKLKKIFAGVYFIFTANITVKIIQKEQKFDQRDNCTECDYLLEEKISIKPRNYYLQSD